MSSKLCPYCMKMSDGDTCSHCGKSLNYVGSPAHLPVGYVVSGRHPYVLGAALGQGGFGITYIALDMVTKERVAIKEYYPTYCSVRNGHSNISANISQEEAYTKGKARFLDEAKTLTDLSDLENIVNVMDFFEANNTAYLVMEYLEGSSLKDYAAKNGVFPVRKFLDQIKPLMEDLHQMHQRGVIHRDIAPDNIMLLPDGRMKLIDFGAARSFISGKSMTMVVKKGFAPVEQYLSRGATASSDVYALAATIYYCISGNVPPDSADRQYENTHMASLKELVADITPQQEKAILKAMKVQQKERTQTVEEFLDDLFGRKKPFLFLLPRRRKLLLLIPAVVLLLIGGFFLFSDKASRQENNPAAAELTEATSQAESTAATEAEETEATEAETTEATEAETTPATEAETTPEEAETKSTSGTPATNQPSTSKPSSGGSSSGGSSSGSSSSGGSSSGSSSSGGSSSGSSSSGSSSSGSSSSGSSSSGSSSSGSSSSGSSSSGSSSSDSSSGGNTTVIIPPPVILPPPVLPPPVILPPPVLPPPIILP